LIALNQTFLCYPDLAHAALRQFDNFLCNKPRRRIVSHPQPERVAYVLKRQ